MPTFEQEIQAAQRPLLNYIAVLCGSPQDAEDVLGEVNLALVRQQADYDGERPFLPWARTIAYFAVRTWRQKRRREHLVFDEALVESLAADEAAASAPRSVGDRSRYLAEARRELTPEMQYLVTRHYVYGESLNSIGLQLNRSPHALAVSLHYIRGVLRRSVAKKMKEPENGK